MLQSLANQIIQQVEHEYNHIAARFSDTRHDPWPEFELLKQIIQNQQLTLLDIGCGNGRLAQAIPVVHYTGLDLSSQLLAIAQRRWPQYQFVHGSILQLPFPKQQFDVVACVATLQHVPSAGYRQQAMKEIGRVLKPGGTVFMLNWNLMHQPHYQSYQADQAAGYDAGDYSIPWKNDQGDILAQRYYHGFTVNELQQLLNQARLIVVSNAIGPEQRNIITIAQKEQELS